MSTNIAVPIHAFFEQHMVAERGLSQHTILSYRDTLKLLLVFAGKALCKRCEELSIEDLTADMVRKFLAHLETTRRNGVRTRNARLAAIHAFFRYLAIVDPRFLAQCQSIIGVPFKRYVRPVLDYLQRDEVTTILGQINRDARNGQRDDAILRLLYNTGARAQEIVSIDVPDIRFSRPYLVRLHGKGHKERTCPLWPDTMTAIKSHLQERSAKPTDRMPLFVNRRGDRLTRFGLRYIIGRWVAVAGKATPALLTRKIGPHTSSHDSHAPSAIRGGIKHDPIVAGPFQHRDHARIHRNRSGDEAQNAELLPDLVAQSGQTGAFLAAGCRDPEVALQAVVM